MLKDILNRRIEVDWKGGKVLHIQELTVKDWREMVEIEKIEDPVKEVNKRVKFVAKSLNRNLEGVRINESDLEGVNVAYINAIWTLLLMQMNSIANDPN